LASQVKIDTEAVKLLTDVLKQTDLTEIEYQTDSLRIRVSRSVPQTTIVPFAESVQAPVTQHQIVSASEPKSEGLENHPGTIEAQMVGTVYLSPGPGAGPFVSVGDMVSKGQTLFIIEAMKVMNMIKSPRSGKVKHIFVRDSQPVEYGDPIIIVD